MNDKIFPRLKEYALNKWPNEAVAILTFDKITGESNIIFCENVARNKKTTFAIKDNIYLKEKLQENKHLIIFHSHCDTSFNKKINNFSEEDIKKSEESGHQFLLYNTSTDYWNFYEPKTYEPPPLLQRPFVQGLWNCYTLGKDYFKIKKNIILDYFFLPENADVYNFDTIDKNFYNQNFSEVNFDDIKEGCCLLFKIGNKTRYSNHIGLYVGENKFIHHSINKLSMNQQLNNSYINRIHKILKYND